MPGEDTPASRPDAGAVIVIYGSGTGLTTTTAGIPASQFWSQNAAGVAGISETGDSFGSALPQAISTTMGSLTSLLEHLVDDNEFALRSGKVMSSTVRRWPHRHSFHVPSSQSFDVTDFDRFLLLCREELRIFFRSLLRGAISMAMESVISRSVHQGPRRATPWRA